MLMYGLRFTRAGYRGQTTSTNINGLPKRRAKTTNPVIYADYNSTTPCPPEVVEAVRAALVDGFGNPSTRHTTFGRAARGIVDGAREALAARIGSEEDEIIFTSGATEACNLAIYGVATRLLGSRPCFFAAATEHEAVLEPLRHIGRSGGQFEEIAVDRNGRIDLHGLAFDDKTALVCVMLANNETGVLQDIPELAERVHAAGALLLCDTTQALGKMPLNVSELGADFCVFSAHKGYGPKGVGALWKRRGLGISPIIRGGGQEAELRSGTENTPGLAGWTAALGLDDFGHFNLAEKTERLESQLRAALPELQINGTATKRLGGTSSLTIPGLPKGWLVQLRDVAASSGSSCASADGKPSHVLAAMGLSEKDAANSLRVSLGRPTTNENIDHIATRLIDGAKKLQSDT